MKIDEKVLLDIEEALGIKLFPNQRDYLLGRTTPLGTSRQSGRTVAYCIKLALSEGHLLDFTTRTICEPLNAGEYVVTVQRIDCFKHTFYRIWTILKDKNFPVREAKFFLNNKRGRI